MAVECGNHLRAFNECRVRRTIVEGAGGRQSDPLDDLLRRTRRSDESGPRGDLELPKPRLGKRRDIGHLCRAFLAIRDRQRAELARPDVVGHRH